MVPVTNMLVSKKPHRRNTIPNQPNVNRNLLSASPNAGVFAFGSCWARQFHVFFPNFLSWVPNAISFWWIMGFRLHAVTEPSNADSGNS